MKIVLVHISGWEEKITPLASYYLKLYVEKKIKNIDIKVLDFNNSDKNEKIIRKIIDINPNVVGFSCYSWNFEKVVFIARKLKNINSKIITIFGGPDVYMKEEKIFKDANGNIIVIGEGEKVFSEIIKEIKNNYSLNVNIKKVIKSQKLIDTNEIPSPYLEDCFKNKKYSFWIYETSRGCPFNCKFCMWANTKKVRYFNEKRIQQEIKWLIDNLSFNANKTNKIFLADSDLFLNKQRAFFFLNELKKYEISSKINFFINTQVENLTEDLIKNMSEIPNLILFIGIQHLNNKILKNLNRKPIKTSNFYKITKSIIENKFKGKICFQLIVGIPSDSKHIFLKSFRKIKNIVITLRKKSIDAYIQVFPFEIFASTFQREVKDGSIIITENAPHLVLHTQTFPYNNIIECWQYLNKQI